MSGSSERERLVAAYQKTEYVVREADAEIVAHIGERSPALEVLLARHGAASGTFMTAWNPRSEPQSREANAAAAERLASLLRDRGHRWLPHDGRSKDSDWREEGFFVLDLPEAEALAVAAEFGQNAVVRVDPGQPARLSFTALMPE